MKPNYLVIGAPKCGSTTLSSLLAAHPEIYMVPHEVGFFALDEKYKKGISWYEELFLPGENLKCIGENSNYYTMKEIYPLAFERLLNYFDIKNLKLIYIVRNPLERIESFWIEKRSHGGEDVHYDFNIAVKKNRDWLLDVSNYWRQLEPFRKHFSDEQILVMFLEDLKVDQYQTMYECYSFLGVDPKIASNLSSERLNPFEKKKVVKPFKSRLRELQGYRLVVSLLPMTIRRFLSDKLFMQKVASRPQWNPETKAWAIQELAEDTHKFLEYCGKPVAFWEEMTNVNRISDLS